jgi:DtxR family transcriptional regulator, Mn-dependent transcriptional regulator
VSSTTEDYLKRILAESQRTGEQVVSLGRLASLAEVTPGTVTSMMKRLETAGLVEYLPRQGVRLTGHGKQDANRMLRRHRLIELFLVETLGLDWADVHSEAEVLEHAVSDRVLDRIDVMLGHPTADPHGDPIPSINGTVAAAQNTRLPDAASGGSYRISRITHDEPTFLDYLKRTGLMPGQVVKLNGRDEQAMTVEVSVGGHTLTMSLEAADRILVEST